MKRVGISRHGMGGHGAGLASRMAPLIALAMSLSAHAATVPEVLDAGKRLFSSFCKIQHVIRNVYTRACQDNSENCL